MTTAGQPAGGLELLMEPEQELVARVRDMLTEGGIDLHDWETSLGLARYRANQGEYHRSEMPVIDEEDLADLKTFLLDHLDEFCDRCEITPIQSLPTQCQIYVDKSLKGTIASGVEGTMKFLKSNHLVVDSNGRIIDGHHRWLSAMLIDPWLSLPAFRLRARVEDVLKMLLAFSDSRHERNK